MSNATNKTRFAVPATVRGSEGFGTVTSAAGDFRKKQFGVPFSVLGSASEPRESE